jgi:hypothetical protein
VGAIAAALWLLNDLAQLGMGEVNQPLLIRVMTAMVVTVGLMTGMQVQTKAWVPRIQTDELTADGANSADLLSVPTE